MWQTAGVSASQEKENSDILTVSPFFFPRARVSGAENVAAGTAGMGYNKMLVE